MHVRLAGLIRGWMDPACPEKPTPWIPGTALNSAVFPTETTLAFLELGLDGWVVDVAPHPPGLVNMVDACYRILALSLSH